MFEQSTAQLTEWSAEISDLRAANEKLQTTVERESGERQRLHSELQASTAIAARQQRELDALTARSAASDALVIKYQAGQIDSEAAFARVRDQLAMYTTRLEAMQVRDIVLVLSGVG